MKLTTTVGVDLPESTKGAAREVEIQYDNRPAGNEKADAESV